MIETRDKLNDALGKYFGFHAFKGEQKEIIQSILSGRDTFVIMPTGGGKSLCYQLPAILSEGTAVIISPLIALMKNQVDLIRGYSQVDKIAHFLNSSLNKSEKKTVMDDIAAGHTKMLYVAPETLTKQSNLDFLREANVSFVAVDEAHCISEWGHDFRPEYRKIRDMIEEINSDIPIIALTATATPKVRTDIVKTLHMRNPNLFVSSFLRENLYYEIKPKGKKDPTVKDIIRFIKSQPGESGIIYCLNRKTTEELAQILNVNGIKASPYHAGLESSFRTKAQDMFLMEDVDVIVATIAFGMGIDKPDVRYVIHYNIPKSLENYYQETGRAGRDGLLGKCIAYYNPGDLLKMEKFLRDKPVAEREIGNQHLMEVAGYAESSACRRQLLLHYFGETYDTSRCGNGECDNCAFPKEKISIKKEVGQVLQIVKDLKEQFRIPHLIHFLLGKKTQDIGNYKHDLMEMFGCGSEKDELFWTSVIQNSLLQELLKKDIEEYGIIKLTPKGDKYLSKPYEIEMALNRSFESLASQYEDDEGAGKSSALDPNLLKMLKDLRKSVAKEMKVPPYVVFQDPSLEEMATQYPITVNELAQISGVSTGKAQRYGAEFIELIARYVEDNEIERPEELVVKSVVNKSGLKVYIIQNIDRKINLEDIARAKDMTYDELIQEIETIVASGTKVNIDYYINEKLDDYQQEELYDFFRESEIDDINAAYHELKDEGYTIEEIQLMRIKFLSEMAN